MSPRQKVSIPRHNEMTSLRSCGGLQSAPGQGIQDGGSFEPNSPRPDFDRGDGAGMNHALKRPRRYAQQLGQLLLRDEWREAGRCDGRCRARLHERHKATCRAACLNCPFQQANCPARLWLPAGKQDQLSRRHLLSAGHNCRKSDSGMPFLYFSRNAGNCSEKCRFTCLSTASNRSLPRSTGDLFGWLRS